MPLADRTDGVWANWSGESPARLVEGMFADSLSRGRRRTILRLALPAEPGNAAGPLTRPVDDDQAIRAARRTSAEVVVTGSVDAFTHDDRMDAGKFSRWGMGAPDARSHVRVSVTLRALDVHDGTVLIETTASRDKAGRTTAMVDHADRTAGAPAVDALVTQVLGEVLGDLSRTIGERIEGCWKARVLSEHKGMLTLDAGVSRGLFAGERLDVWRPGYELLDEDLMQLGDDVWVGAVVITSFQGQGRSRARLSEGEVHVGDTLRPCALAAAPALSLKR